MQIENLGVIIHLYHVVDEKDVHRFITTNDRFIQHIGGPEKVEQRLRDEFRAHELIGTYEWTAGIGGDQLADEAIVSKIKAIATQFPNCYPCPMPWSEGEQRKDAAKALADSLGFASDLEKKLITDLFQIQGDVPNIKVVIALVQHEGVIKAAIVLNDATMLGFRLQGQPDGGNLVMTALPHLGGPAWIPIPHDRLRVREVEPEATEPLLYFVLRTDDSFALALAPRKLGGRLSWSGSEEFLSEIENVLVDIGIIGRRVVATCGEVDADGQ
jgi:hypothetical protein